MITQRLTHQAKHGFTLIEILIVVVILGILAAIVIPQFTDASQEAGESAGMSTLQTVRGQIELCRVKDSSVCECDFPSDLDDLFQALLDNGYLQSVPTLAADFEWAVDSSGPCDRLVVEQDGTVLDW